MTAPQEYATIEIGDLTEEELDQFRALAIRIVERRKAGAIPPSGPNPSVGNHPNGYYGEVAHSVTNEEILEAIQFIPGWPRYGEETDPALLQRLCWPFEVGDTLHYQSPSSAPYWWRVDSLGDDPQKNFGFIGLQCTESENGPDIPGGMIVKPGNLRRDARHLKHHPKGRPWEPPVSSDILRQLAEQGKEVRLSLVTNGITWPVFWDIQIISAAGAAKVDDPSFEECLRKARDAWLTPKPGHEYTVHEVIKELAGYRGDAKVIMTIHAAAEPQPLPARSASVRAVRVHDGKVELYS